MKVLIVEDSSIQGALFKKMLLKINDQFKVTIAISVDTFRLEISEQDKPDVIFCDMNLPDGKGLDCVNFIRKDLGLAIPMVAMSAQSENEVIMKCIIAGANHFIRKPFSLDEIKRALSVCGL